MCIGHAFGGIQWGEQQCSISAPVVDFTTGEITGWNKIAEWTQSCGGGVRAYPVPPWG
jgi:hypothetical protein